MSNRGRATLYGSTAAVMLALAVLLEPGIPAAMCAGFTVALLLGAARAIAAQEAGRP